MSGNNNRHCAARDAHTDPANAGPESEKQSSDGDMFRKLAENAPVAMSLIDREGNIKYINPKFEELFGYRLHDIPEGRIWFRKAFPDAAYRHEAIRSWIEDSGHFVVGEIGPRSYNVACKDGTNKAISFIMVKLKDGERIITCEDITERRRAVRDLRLAHQQLWDIIEFLPDATFVIDKDKRVIAWNRAIEEMTGVLKQDIIGKGDYAYGIPFYGKARPILIDLVSDKDEEIEALYNYFIRKGDTIYAECNIVHLPGGRIFIWAKATPLLDNDGNIVGAIESIRDITDRKRSEEAVEEANLKLQALIRASPLAILTFDPAGRVLSWNDAAERIFGWKEEEVLGRFPPFLTPDRMHEFHSLINIAAQGKVFAGLELQRVKKDGTTIEISLSSAPIRDAKGSVQGIMSVLDDITKRKTAERSLRENLHFMQKLMDTIPNPIICKNMDGRFIRCNLAFEKFVNLSRDQIVGKTNYDIFPPDQAKSCSSSDAFLFSEPGIRIEETTMQLYDGRKADIISNKATYTNENGSLAGLVEVIIDITDLKTSEAELRAAKEAAEEAARAKAEFLANMSHEIRTPLNAVIGMTGLLLDADLSVESKDAVETIRSSGDTLLAIINDILDFSKIDSGNMELERLPFDLSTCVEESLDLIAAKAAEKGLNLAYLMDEGAPKSILGDLTRLRQILVNLISNAVKFTDDGEVVVSVSSRHLVDEYHEIRFSIKDTGIGISEPQKNRLFRSFSQIDASTSRKYGGTGLGLAISRRLVELMGGRIWVDSETGKGSDFQFTIVTEVRPASPKAHQHPSQPKLAGKKLLIVDGFDTNLKILDRLAKGWGMKPTVASGPMDALDRMRGDVWDAVVMSTSIRGMDPVSLANEVRANQISVPIILCTSFGQKRDDCNQFASFLSKPIKPALLHEALLNIFDEKASKNSVPEKTTPAVRHPLRILLAEDNAVNQKVALKMLKKIGYRADLAANGLEVLQALERLPYDVVLMDVQMPEMDGLEATRRIRELWPTGGPKVVAITAYAMEGDRERCLGAGMDDYISKPVQIQELAGALVRCQAAMEECESARSLDMRRAAN